ncbi:MAG: succinate dehydrogenase, cytochrome b556 subunit [Gammaproteobacteria bacterium]|nr:succinate dehydrogenase, cytochrome b556 subunit [Gammaproteobacteria bacterium]MBD3776156.1 succinate dehydrogenase, cytochrome b556 subunit [Thiotrichales bacterium]
MYQFPGNRPVYLNLRRFHFPLNAWLSALHRITGLILFICLLGYLFILNLLVLHPLVTLDAIRDHCILRCLHSAFWISLSYHWLAGLRHLLAEHFTQPAHYAAINSKTVSRIMLIAWGALSLFIGYVVWGAA